MVSASTTWLLQSELTPTTTATDGSRGGATRRRGAGRGGGGGGGGGDGDGGGGGGASVVAVEVVEAAAEVVEAVAVVVAVAAAVVLVEVQPHSVEALMVASVSSNRTQVRPRRFSSFVSGTLGVGGLGVQVPALTFFAPALVVGRCVGSHTPRSAALVA
ncbi:unnamed protein product [Closterium sp. NIES-54]